MAKYDDTLIQAPVWMSDRDFMYLRTNEVRFKGWNTDHPGQTDRFVTDDDARTPMPDTWEKAYFFERRSDVVLAAAYLTGRRAPFQYGYDMYEDDGHGGIVPDTYVLFTDYEYDGERRASR